MAAGKDIKELEKIVGYPFRDIRYLKTAMTHTSYANERRGTDSYQRMEFLGDAVLQILISDFLYRNFPDATEGELTRYRQHLVCEETLIRLARRLQLQDFLLLGNGEEANRKNEQAKILADAFEALLAAIYLDSNRSTSFLASFLLAFMKQEIATCDRNRGGDYKTRLQQLVQQDGKEKLYYIVVSESGPSHKKVYEVDAMLNSNRIGHGSGTSVLKAEQAAAKEALSLFGDTE